MHLNIKHTFTQAEAVARVKAALTQAAAQIEKNAQDITQEWEGNTLNFAFSAAGARVTGALQVLENEFVLDAKLPLLWRMFEGRIQKAIEAQMAQQQK